MNDDTYLLTLVLLSIPLTLIALVITFGFAYHALRGRSQMLDPQDMADFSACDATRTPRRRRAADQGTITLRLEQTVFADVETDTARYRVCLQ